MGDTALVWCDLDVSLSTPGWSPRVLHEEVLLAVLGSVADGEDTVVESGAASVGDDTTGVSLEDELVGLDGRSELRSNGESKLSSLLCERGWYLCRFHRGDGDGSFGCSSFHGDDC